MDFIKGNIAGYIGAISVYPIDLIKSNMQLQNNIYNYKNGFDCFKQIVKKKGITKLYSGSFVQLIGVGPEKAIKLFINEKLLSYNCNTILAGSLAGLGQIIITNPIEIIKIQYQINLDKKINLQKSFELIGGYKNLYKGAGICAMRDIPFSSIYFHTYSIIKNYTNNYLLSGMISAIPAAYLVTPFDVIKTRIQAKPDIYNGIIFTFTKILNEEGPKAFFKGGFWRVAKSSPQFGITAYVYEKLK